MTGSIEPWPGPLVEAEPEPRPERPVRLWRVAGGVAIALVCHVPAFTLLTYAALMLDLQDTDAMLYILGMVMVALDALSFAVCVPVGVWLVVRPNHDVSIGIGLLGGWTGGLAVLLMAAAVT